MNAVEQLLEQAKALPEPSRAWLAERLAQDVGSDVEQTFVELAEHWRRETGPHSSVSKMVPHPAYLSIIGLGRPVVPLLLRALQQQPGKGSVLMIDYSARRSGNRNSCS